MTPVDLAWAIRLAKENGQDIFGMPIHEEDTEEDED